MKFRIFPPKSIKLIIVTILFLLFTSLPTYATLWGNKTDISTEDFRRIVTELRIYDDPDLPYYNEIFSLYYSGYTGSEELLDALNKKIEITQQVMKTLDTDIKKEELGNLTYGRYILNAINEEELVEMGIKTGCSPDQANGEYFSKLGENLADWKSQLSKFLLTKIIEATCTAMGAPALSIGISTLGLFCDLSIIGTSINKLNEVWYEKAFWSYMLFRNAHNYGHTDAWTQLPESYINHIFILSPEKQKKAREAIEENFESLWNKYGDHIVNNELDKNFKSQQRESLKILLLYALEAEPHPLITSPLKITPPFPYQVGDTVNAEFTIANQGKLPIDFSVLTIGGRDPDNHVADFTHRQNITLEPSKSYDYQGTLTLNKVGDYHFFCTYQTPDGDWNTNVDLGSGLVDEDRAKEVVVIARESEDAHSVSLGYPEKILPVKPRIIGKPAPGYYISQILAKPDEIKIFGNYSKINNLEFLETIPINMSGITKTLSVKVPPALNEGLNIVEGETTLIEVTIQVKEALVKKTLPAEMIEINLYFSDSQAMYLVPERKKILKTSTLARHIINELIKGPASPDLYPTIPQGTQVNEVYIAGDIVYIDLSEEVFKNHPGGSSGQLMTVYSIVNTLTEIPSIRGVQILVEGNEMKSLVGHIDISMPLLRDEDWIKP